MYSLLILLLTFATIKAQTVEDRLNYQLGTKEIEIRNLKDKIDRAEANNEELKRQIESSSRDTVASLKKEITNTGVRQKLSRDRSDAEVLDAARRSLETAKKNAAQVNFTASKLKDQLDAIQKSNSNNNTALLITGFVTIASLWIRSRIPRKVEKDIAETKQKVIESSEKPDATASGLLQAHLQVLQHLQEANKEIAKLNSKL